MTDRRGGFYLKESDLELIRWLADYRYLQPSHLQKLSGRHIVSLRRRLRQLLAERLVDRLTLPLSRSRPIDSPPDQYVYRLGSRGVKLAREALGLDAVHTEDKKATFLEHDLAISAFHLGLELMARESDGRVVLQWRQTGLQDWARDPDGQRLSVNPDALFSFTDLRLPVDRNTNHFFLEVERSRQHGYANGESSFVRKVQAYDAYSKQGRHRQTWGIDGFRVLVIVPTVERAENQRIKVTNTGLEPGRFLFAEERLGPAGIADLLGI